MGWFLPFSSSTIEILRLSFILIVIYFMVAACNAWLSSGIVNVSMRAVHAQPKITTRFLDFIEIVIRLKTQKKGYNEFYALFASLVSDSDFFSFEQLNLFSLISIGLHFIMKFCGRNNIFFSPALFRSFLTILFVIRNNCIVLRRDED